MKSFKWKRYDLQSDKIASHRPVRLMLLSDQHQVSLGPENQYLLQMIRQRNPDVVLIAGDMVIGRTDSDFSGMYRLIKTIVDEYPVYYAYGNHEQRMSECPCIYGEAYLEYEEALKKDGVKFLSNAHDTLLIGGNRLTVYGLTLERSYYKKPFSPKADVTHIRKLIGESDSSAYTILLAHNPGSGDAYLNWGADLTLCGHYHGGMLRLWGHIGLIAPDFTLFPKYCYGMYQREEQAMIVSPGLGEHTVPLRFHNSRELIEINLHR